MRRTILVSASACAAAAVALWSPAARGTAAGWPAAPEPNLEIVIIGDQSTADLLSVAIAPLLTEMEPLLWRQLRTTSPISDAGRPGVARLWIDAHRRGGVSVVGFSRSGSPRVRSVEAAELTPVVAETIAQIVHETAVTLIAEPAAAEAGAPTAEADAGGRAAAIEAPVARREETFPAAPGARRLEASLELGYLVRDVATLNQPIGQGATASASLWFPHEALRSFVTVGFDWTYAPMPGAPFSKVSLIPTAGISWSPGSPIDVRTSIGVGLEYYDWYTSGWFAAARAALAFAVPLPERLELVLSVMVDAKPQFVGSDAYLEPGATLAVGWRP